MQHFLVSLTVFIVKEICWFKSIYFCKSNYNNYILYYIYRSTACVTVSKNNIQINILILIFHTMKVIQTIAHPALPTFSDLHLLLSCPLHHFLLLSPIFLQLPTWWSRDVYGEVWQLDHWLSHRPMSISTRSDNSDSITMNISMSKQQAANMYSSMHTYTITTWWSGAIR